jgi:glycosyltransferase involved in cell wall biosynthesis
VLPDRLKILAVATEWDSGHGGSTFNRELCRALANLGHDVYCAVPQLEPTEVARAKADGVTLVAPKQLPGPVDHDALYRKLDGLPADVHVILGHARITGKYALAQLTDHRPEAQYVHFLHMDPRLIEPLKPGERANRTQTAEDRANLEVGLGTNASVVVAVGPELTRSFTFYFHGRGGVVHEFLPGLFQSDWDAQPPDGQCLVFGRAEDEELKGIDLATDSMRIVCEDEGFDLTRLVVRGAPADEGDDLQKRLSKKTEGRPRVDVRPYTSDREQVLAEVRASGLVLMLSREEGFGLTGLEAISQGIPVLVSKTSGLGQALLRELPETMLYVHVAEAHPRELPEHVRDAASSETDPDRRILSDARCPWQNRGKNSGDRNRS